MEGYRFFRKDEKGRQREGVALYVREQLEYMELCLGMGEGIKIKGRTGKGNITMATCCGPLGQEE